MMEVHPTTKEELLNVIENEAKIRIDSFVEGAIELAEEVHSGVKREDGKSSFLETHVWPVTIDVIQHYQQTNRLLTTLQIVSSLLHDVMEDNDKILDLNASKAYGFDAYFKHRFGEYVYNIAMTLKTKPLENYFGTNNEQMFPKIISKIFHKVFEHFLFHFGFSRTSLKLDTNTIVLIPPQVLMTPEN